MVNDDEAQTSFEDTVADLLSTSAQLRQTQRDLAASQADLSRVEGERNEALGELHILRNSEDLHIVTAKAELASARAELEKLRAENDRLGRLVKQAAERLDDLTEARRWQVARQDAGPCLMCGLPMVRSQAVKPVPSTTKGTWMHVECPDASAFRWVAARDGQPEGEVLLHLRRPTPTNPEETS